MKSGPLTELLRDATRHLFFTGKGGVGKTSLACGMAIALADMGRRVLLVSTDPASNLDEVLGTELTAEAKEVPSVERLSAFNIDPEAAARAYRERVVAPYRGRLPEAAIASIEEQLSGACTVEMAAFDEFSKLLGSAATERFDHVVFDTAPTGHTLRLLMLPAAWSGYLRANNGAASCLGPLGGLQGQRHLYEATASSLSDPALTTLLLVTRPERGALDEAERTRSELASAGLLNQRLIVNGVFDATDRMDPSALALEARGKSAMAGLSAGLATLARTSVPLFARSLVGVPALRLMLYGEPDDTALPAPSVRATPHLPALFALMPEIAASGHGVVMTMGKGGVGKTTVAAAVALELARLGHRVHLTTTDPAAHVAAMIDSSRPNLRISRIDPAEETERYMSEVRAIAAPGLDTEGRALLEEDLRSPCTEEIAVFRAFARTIAEGEDGFVVLDTAPTGHTLLLLDATETYHREVSRNMSGVPEAVGRLLPRLRDPSFTKVLIVTLPEATPVHEAARLQQDLQRAEIRPFAWVVNQSFAASGSKDPTLVARGVLEQPYIAEVQDLADRASLIPWRAEAPVGAERLHAFSRAAVDEARA